MRRPSQGAPARLLPSVVLALVLVWLLPGTIYCGIARFSSSVLDAVADAASICWALTSLGIVAEALMGATRSNRFPSSPKDPPPRTSFIIPAYLPNENAGIVDAVRYLVNHVKRPPDGIEILVPYNGPSGHPVENRLRMLGSEYPEVCAFRVFGSTTKAENLNAALVRASGRLVVILDCDHRPSPDCIAHAWPYIAAGYAAVQGRNVLRAATGLIGTLVAIETEGLYGVSHPSVYAAAQSSVFGGANACWRADVLRTLAFDPTMLTEDIDLTLRSLLAGHRIAFASEMVSSELPPDGSRAWWSQRKRWAHGWFQTTLRHQIAVLRSGRLGWRTKATWTYLLGWRELHALLGYQVVPLAIAGAITGWSTPWGLMQAFALTLTLLSGPIHILASWRRRLGSCTTARFALYALLLPAYNLVKALVTFSAWVDHLRGDRIWIVTPRQAEQGCHLPRRRNHPITTK